MEMGKREKYRQQEKLGTDNKDRENQWLGESRLDGNQEGMREMEKKHLKHLT